MVVVRSTHSEQERSECQLVRARRPHGDRIGDVQVRRDGRRRREQRRDVERVHVLREAERHEQYDLARRRQLAELLPRRRGWRRGHARGLGRGLGGHGQTTASGGPVLILAANRAGGNAPARMVPWP